MWFMWIGPNCGGIAHGFKPMAVKGGKVHCAILSNINTQKESTSYLSITPLIKFSYSSPPPPPLQLPRPHLQYIQYSFHRMCFQYLPDKPMVYHQHTPPHPSGEMVGQENRLIESTTSGIVHVVNYIIRNIT